METYNTSLALKFGDDIFTHPPNDSQLWVEVAAGDGLDRNYIDGVFMALAQEMRASQIISILGTLYPDTLYPGSSNTSQNFDELV